jgi:xanthine dehydrogenase YagT iron-sulfur-binding subunit
MSKEESDDKAKLSRRNFLKGAGAGAVVGAVAVAGIEEGLRIPGMQLIGTTTTQPGQTVTQTTTKTVTASLSAVTASISASPSSVQSGSSVTFTATPGGGTPPYTISINCGDGTTLTAAGAHTYASAGNYTALLTVTDSVGSKGMAVTQVVVTGAATLAQPVSGATITMAVNGVARTVYVESRDTLLDTLRVKLGLTGAKRVCDRGECGSCMVSIDGKPYLSCTTLAIECDGRNVQTIESFPNDPATLKILNAFIQNDAFQCGYCASGFEIATKLLLAANPHPTKDQARQWLSGNLCRCGVHNNAVNAVLALGGGS